MPASLSFCWHLLTKKTNLLTSADICWQLLTRRFLSTTSTCILTFADTYWHLLTFADICWRLLNLSGSNDATIFLKRSNHTGRSLACAHILRVSNLIPETCLGRTFLAKVRPKHVSASKFVSIVTYYVVRDSYFPNCMCCKACSWIGWNCWPSGKNCLLWEKNLC